MTATNMPDDSAAVDPSETQAGFKEFIQELCAALRDRGDPLGVYGSPMNLGLAFSVGSNALTCRVKQRDGSTDPDNTNSVPVAMRSSTLSSGTFNNRNVLSATSLVISSGSTLGHSNATAGYIYWYLIDNSGTLELAASTKFFGMQGIVTTTAEGGAGAADSATTMYSTTARTNVAFLCIARSKDTQTTAGTWAATPSEVLLAPFELFDSPVFTGTPILPTGTTATTQSAGDNSTKLATTAFVAAAIGTTNQTASGSTTIDFTGLDFTTNLGYEVFINALLPATTNTDLQIQLTDDTVINWDNFTTGRSLSDDNGSGATNITSGAIFTGQKNASPVGMLHLRVTQPDVTSDAIVQFDGFYTNNSSVGIGVVGRNTYAYFAAVKGIRFKYSSGNISTGKFILKPIPR